MPTTGTALIVEQTKSSNKIMKVIFLDIDGVIQPTWSQKRFKHLDDICNVASELDKAVGGFPYYDYVTQETFPDGIGRLYTRKCNLAAVYYDWSQSAIDCLRQVLEECNAKIVVSSDWRDHGAKVFKAFLAVHGLDVFFYDMIDGTSYEKPSEKQTQAHNYFQSVKPADCRYLDHRASDIREYLSRHQEITSFVAIDDRDLAYPLCGHFVYCDKIFDSDKGRVAIDILKCEDGPYPLL